MRGLCLSHAACGAQSWCDDENFCKPCREWDPLDLTASVTGLPPEPCKGVEERLHIVRDACEVLEADSCPCSSEGCWRAVGCVGSPLCASGQEQALLRRAPSSAALVTALCVGDEEEESSARRLTEDLFALLRTLRSVGTALPIHTLVFPDSTSNDTAALLAQHGSRLLPIARNAFPPPVWSFGRRRGTFSKLAVLTLLQFEARFPNRARGESLAQESREDLALLTPTRRGGQVVVFIDSDCRVMRNIDHLSRLPSLPAFAFAAQDRGLNSGMMVLQPRVDDARRAAQMTRAPSDNKAEQQCSHPAPSRAVRRGPGFRGGGRRAPSRCTRTHRHTHTDTHARTHTSRARFCLLGFGVCPYACAFAGQPAVLALSGWPLQYACSCIRVAERSLGLINYRLTTDALRLPLAVHSFCPLTYSHRSQTRRASGLC